MDEQLLTRVLELVDEVLVERGWSARQASIQAVGTPGLIVGMRRGQVPSVSRLWALCNVLGLEFYVGRRRTLPGVDFDLARVAETLGLMDDEFPDAPELLSGPQRAELFIAIYRLLGDQGTESRGSRVREFVAITRRFGVPDPVDE